MTSGSLNKTMGFTLVELIVVIILIGILSTTVIPKLFSSNGFEEYTYRNELITKLRAIQLRAMQQTSSAVCNRVVITPDQTQIGLLATDTDQSNNCHISKWHSETTHVSIDSDHSVSFTSADLDQIFFFNHLGKPDDCDAPCQIKIVGSETLTIQIETEGYISAL